MDCVEYVGNCSGSTADFSSLKISGRYFIRAEGKEAEPHCMGVIIRKGGSAFVSNFSTTYAYRILDIKDTLSDAVDKPIISKYATAPKVSYGDSHP